MSLGLYVDGPRWRAHLRDVASTTAGMVPVAKGNGYGFGMPSLARRAAWLGCDTIAVGTYREVADVVQRFEGDVLVLEPWRPFHEHLTYGPRIVHTVGRAEDLRALGARDDSPRVVLEGLTSMMRHGFSMADLVTAGRHARGVRVEGHALHLPLGRGHLGEVARWLAAAPKPRWFVSHLGTDELAHLRAGHPEVEFRPRIGTSLWLGAPDALSARATVLDVHPVSRGDRAGYRQRKLPRDGTVLVVSGGTSHGIALEAPAAPTSVRRRARSLANGGLEAAGLALSPYQVSGRARWFVEPPHMLVSLIFVPKDVSAPQVGDLVDVRVRHTTTLFDAVHIS